MKRKNDVCLIAEVLVLSFVFLVGGAISSNAYAQEASPVASVEASEERADAVVSAGVEEEKTDLNGNTQKPVELNGDTMEYKADEGKFVASGNVVLKHNGVTLLCEQVEFYREKQEAHAMGKVVIISDQGTVWADKAFYNFGTKKGEFTNARIFASPVFGRAETISKINDGYYVLNNGYLTTSDYDDPEWRIRSRQIEVFPGKKAVARRSTMFLGGVPVMYLPKYVQDLTDNRPHIRVIPGYQKDMGAYLLTSYRTQLTDHIGTTYHLDYRERKDLAWGVDVEYVPPGFGQGLVKTYYMNERNITSKRIWDERLTSTAERERYRVEWRHKWQIDQATSLIMQYYKLSDADFLKKYFEKEYRADTAPLTYLLVTRNFSNSTLSLRTDVRVNRFDTMVERLPEISYTLNNTAIGDTGFYFKSSNLASNLVQKNASPSDVHPSTMRLDTDNTISYPFKVAFVELSPYVGAEQTYYSRTLNTKDQNDQVRSIFKTGVDASAKFYRVYDVNFKKFGVEVNRLRHVVTPTISYLYQHAPKLDSSKLVQFDTYDSRAQIDKFVLGLENKFQTKRQQKIVDLFRSLLTADFRLKDNPSSGSFGDVTLTNEFYPNEYVTFHSDATYNNDAQHLQTANFDIYLKDNKKWEFDVSRRFTHDDDDLVTTQLTYIFNPKWRTVLYDRWNVDNGRWQEQQYALVRDLHSWETEFAYRQRQDNESSGTEVWIIFRLKAFPSVKLDGGSSFNQRKAGAQGL